MATAALTGKHVLIHDLKSATGLALNGLCALCEAFDEASGRYAVRVPTKAVPMLLREANLQRTPDAPKTIASACAAEHAEEVLARARAVAAGERHEEVMERVVLDLESTGLRQLPEMIGAFDQAQELWLGGNELSALPSSIGGLRALRVLDVDGNALACLPDALGMLVGLESLFANNNALEALPESLGELRALRELRVAGNQLGTRADALPASLAKLRSLRTLWLARNALTGLPSVLCALTSLEELDLAQNALVALPAELCERLRLLHTLELHANPTLTSPPLSIAVRGVEEVRSWLKAHAGQTTTSATQSARGVDGTQVTADIATPSVVYAHEPPGSAHTPLPDVVEDGLGGGSFIFPPRG